jgi:hypothetical protein
MGKWRKAHALKGRVRFEIKVGADRLGILRATGPNCQSAQFCNTSEMPNVDPLADFQRQRHVLLDQQDRHADAMQHLDDLLDGWRSSLLRWWFRQLKTIMGLVQTSDGKVLFNGDEKS